MGLGVIGAGVTLVDLLSLEDLDALVGSGVGPLLGEVVVGVLLGDVVTLVGLFVGLEVGEFDGLTLGEDDGDALGDAVGVMLGIFEGLALGDAVGLIVGPMVPGSSSLEFEHQNPVIVLLELKEQTSPAQEHEVSNSLIHTTCRSASQRVLKTSN